MKETESFPKSHAENIENGFHNFQSKEIASLNGRQRKAVCILFNSQDKVVILGDTK